MSNRARPHFQTASCVVILITLGSGVLWADSPAQQRADRLVVEQTRVADQYDRFKKNIIDLADFLRQNDPERAEVLEKAVLQMNRGDALAEFQRIVDLLGQNAVLISEMDEAILNQEALETELQALLALLLTENQQSQNQSEKQRVARYLKQINRMIRMQKGIQAETDRVTRPKELAQQQAKLGKQCQSLAEKMQSDSGQPKKAAPSQQQAEKQTQQSDKEGRPGS